MELRHLRYFVAVAEDLHFTRAAKRLGIKQPPLSAQIRQLETEMGSPLFRRFGRGIEMTPAGKLFYEEARRILEQVDHAKQGAQRRARGEVGRMNVGFAGATYFHPTIIAILREFRARFPNVALSPTQGTSSMLNAQLEAGALDVAFVRTMPSTDAGVSADLLMDEELVVALPTGHRLAGMQSVPLSALAQENFVLCPRKLNVPLYDRFISACRRAGFIPIVGSEAPDVVSIVPLVAGGFGVSLVPRSLERVHLPGVVWLPLAGEGLSAPIRIAYRGERGNAAVRNFLAVARKVAGTTETKPEKGS
jgi:DNA-binding transcriptional LysR family regulator